MAGERVDQRGFADIGTPGEGNLRQVGRWQLVEALGGEIEAALGGEQQAPGLDGGQALRLVLFRPRLEQAGGDLLGQDFDADLAGFPVAVWVITRAAFGLESRVLRMISHCCRMVSELFQLQ